MALEFIHIINHLFIFPHPLHSPVQHEENVELRENKCKLIL